MTPSNAYQAQWWERHARELWEASKRAPTVAQWERLNQQFRLARWRAEQFRRAIKK